MPVKVRCKGCQTVLNIPDKARGKAIRCPKCKEVIRVPGGTAAGAKTAGSKSPGPMASGSKAAAPRKRQAEPTIDDDDDFLAGVDLRRSQDARVRVCVKCGQEIDEPDEGEDPLVDCPNCKHNIDTGVMSEYMRLRIARKGPPVEEYWGACWGDSWRFLGNHWRLAMRSGIYYGLFITFLNFAVFMAALYCERIPTKSFWYGLAAVFLFGAVGWFWHLSVNAIRHTMQASKKRRNRPMEFIQFDFFACLALGVKFIVWPVIVISPILLPTLAIGAAIHFAGIDYEALSFGDAVDLFFVDMKPLLIACGCLCVVPYFAFAPAMIHMTMPYSYKAWIGYFLSIEWGKTIGAAMYWFVVAVAAFSPLLVIAGLVFVLVDNLLDWYFYASWSRDLMWDIMGVRPSETPGFGSLIKGMFESIAGYSIFFLLLIIFSLIVTMPIGIILAFCSLPVMRANGLYGLYFKPDLSPVVEQQKGEPCGFWIRYVAMLVDGILWPLASMLVFKSWIISVVAWMINGVVVLLFLYLERDFAIMFSGIVWPTFNLWMYFATTEGSPEQCTIGKYAMGVIVTDSKGEMIDIKRGTIRIFSKILGALPLYAGWIMSAFSPRKQALHDTINNTLVVWRGDEIRVD